MAEVVSTELYKKYRPRTWERMIGQEKVVSSLKTAVAKGKLPTAYLFSGDRGCGKTSAALLLAKAINCPNAIDGEPCNQCDVCKNIDRGVQVGVNYISMANKGSVDDVRDIVQQARLSAPINRQVWILDEVHNLSRQAFDALLIPLEDERMPALFILCTTEIQKIPRTILSRVQPRRFKLVPEDTMRKYLHAVVKKEKLELTEDELTTVIHLGGGSVRDTLTALDRVSETEEVYENFGGQLLEAICDLNLSKALEAVAMGSYSEAGAGRELGDQLFGDLRDLLLAGNGASSDLYTMLPISNPTEAFKKLGGTAGVSMLMEEVGDSLNRMTLGADTRIHLEIAVTRGIKKLERSLKRRDG